VPHDFARHAVAERGTDRISSMIEIDRVGQVYLTKTREIWAIGEVTATIAKGEFVSIVGPSGCGKSTLLNIVAGFIVPTSGTVRVAGGKVEGRIPPNLGYIFQKDTVLPWYRVRDNIALGLRYRGTPERAIREKVAALLTLGHLEGFGDVYPHQLSGGMRRRVALLMTLACDPAILLLDEPFGALDTHTKTLLHKELIEIWRKMRQTVVLVTHNLDEAVTLSDRVLVLSSPPSRVLLDHRIDMPHPRDVFTVRETPEFARHFQAIWRVLGEQFRTGAADELSPALPRP
jgi:NitT/TauT family transport system ATP-binding protein